MGTRYNIAITATDAATARVRAIKAAIRSTIAPITGIGSSIKALGKEVGVARLTGGLKTLGNVATSTLRSIGAISPAMAGLGGIGSIALAGAYTKAWGEAAGATLRFSAVSAVATNKVQDLRAAAKLAGLTAEDMDGAIQGLGTTLQDARWGRNQGALLLMNRLDIRLKKTKTGAIDTAAVLGDLAELLGPKGKLAGAPVQTKQLVADAFGVGALLPMLLKGRDAWEAYQRQAQKNRPAISKEDLERADMLRQKIVGLGLGFENLGNGIMTRIGPTVGGWIDYWTRRLNITADQVRKMGLWETIKTNSIHNTTGVFRPPTDDRAGPLGDWNRFFGNRGPSKADPKAEKDSIDHFKRMGWSDAQAKGIVANMIAESKLDPKAVGDNGAAKGSLQWHKDRQNDYASWAKDQKGTGKTVETATLADQRRFIDFELRKGKEKRAGYHLMQQNDPRAAAGFLSEDYVRPGDHLGEMSHRARTAADLDKRFPQDSLPAKPGKPGEPGKPGQAPGPTDKQIADNGPQDSLPAIWKQKPQKVTTENTLTLNITGLPAGVKADVTDSKGPVKTTLKVESSMPDYNL